MWYLQGIGQQVAVGQRNNVIACVGSPVFASQSPHLPHAVLALRLFKGGADLSQMLLPQRHSEAVHLAPALFATLDLLQKQPPTNPLHKTLIDLLQNPYDNIRTGYLQKYK